MIIDQGPIRPKYNTNDWLWPNSGSSVSLMIDYDSIRPKCNTNDKLRPKFCTYDWPMTNKI